VFGGAGAALGFGPDIKGTAPLDAVGCKTSPNAVAFIFSAQLGADPLLHCEIAAQEIAHAFSADHVLLAEDAMSYLSAGAPKTFRDAAAPCGEFSERACVCGRPSQNSHQLLLERLGAAPALGDDAPPTVSASWQRTRGESANITVTATDDRAVASVQLTVETATGVLRSTCGDGTLSCTPSAGGWVFTVPGVGTEARFSASAQDGVGNLSATAPEQLSATVPVGPKVSAAVTVRPGAQGKVAWVTAAVTGGSGPLSGAMLEWADGVGSAKHAMCQPGYTFGDNVVYFLPIALDASPRARQLTIILNDEHGAVAQSAPQELK
jgi:hypothetical protein